MESNVRIHLMHDFFFSVLLFLFFFGTYEGCQKSSYTHIITIKITAPFSGRYYILIKSVIMFMYKNRSNVHFYIGVIIIYTMSIQAARPSPTLSYDAVSITSLSWVYPRVISYIHRLAKWYNRMLNKILLVSLVDM